MASSSVSKKPKTVRSIAIDKDTLAKILELAEEQKISFNALLESMITYYADIACYGGSIGLTHIEHPNLKLILGCRDANCLNNTPAAGSRDSWEIWAELKGMKRDLPSFFKVLQYHERMGWGVIKVT